MRMTPGKAIVAYLIAVPVFFLIDLIWLGVVARSFYQRHLGYIMRPEVNWTAAIVFYLIFIVGIILFAVKPGLEAQSPLRSLLYGAAFGFFTYATYDLTNLATVRDWPLIVAIVDMAWGTVLCGLVAWATCLISTRL